MRMPWDRLEEFEEKHGTFDEMLSKIGPIDKHQSEQHQDQDQVELRKRLKKHNILIHECMAYDQGMMDSKKHTDEMTTGYMCGIAWDYEIGEASTGTKVYPDIECLKADQGCGEKCGVVEVEVKLKRIVEPGEIRRTGEKRV